MNKTRQQLETEYVTLSMQLESSSASYKTKDFQKWANDFVPDRIPSDKVIMYKSYSFRQLDLVVTILQDMLQGGSRVQALYRMNSLKLKEKSTHKAHSSVN